jgi:glycerol kinase
MPCDQQASLLGHGCSVPGDIKATYGTGAFVLANAGQRPPEPPPGILATIAWTDPGGQTTYALDGGVLSAGSLFDQLRSLHIIGDVAGWDADARSVNDAAGVRVLPALNGLGAPWWRPDARAMIVGLTGATTRAHVTRAALDSIAHRVADVVEAMAPALPGSPETLHVDGGLTASAYLLQRQADLLGTSVSVALLTETTAVGVAAMAWGGDPARDDIHTVSADRRYLPRLSSRARLAERADWRRFVRRAVSIAPDRQQRRSERSGPE